MTTAPHTDSGVSRLARLRLLALRLLLAVAVPLLLGGLLELGLRVGGFGRDLRFFIPDTQPGMVRTNPHFTELFLPASFGLKPVNFRLAAHKPAGTARVFVLGESAAMGVPEPGFGLAPQLEARLRAALPGRRIEVWNCGVTAINSHAVVEIARAALALEPDLLVVYMGNNEVVGPYGAGAVVDSRPMPVRLVRASVWLRRTRTGRLLQQVIAWAGRKAAGFRDWRGMEMFAGHGVPADDPRLPLVYSNFAANLGTILDESRGAGVPVVLSTVAVNVRDCAPFLSHPAAGLTADQRTAFASALETGREALGAGRLAEARAALAQARAIDPGQAEALFLGARAAEADGDVAAAGQLYQEALQHDALRFRADAAINAAIRRAATTAGAGVTLVDAAEALGAAERPAGPRYFFEHVHLTWEGNCALSRLVAEKAARVLGGATAEAEVARLRDGALAERLGFTDLGRLAMDGVMEQLMGRPPFTGQWTFAADRLRGMREDAEVRGRLAQPGALARAQAIIRAAAEGDPTNVFLQSHLASVLLQRGDKVAAQQAVERLSALQPWSAEQACLRAAVAQAGGGDTVAEEELLAAVRGEPYYFNSYEQLAQLWLRTRQVGRGREYFGVLADRMPTSRAVRIPLAQFCREAGDWAAAEAELRAVLTFVPDEEGALRPLVQRLEQTGRASEALELMLAAYRHNPRSFANNGRLVVRYEDGSDEAKTTEYMEALAASGPVNARLFLELAQRMQRGGKALAAEARLHRAREMAALEGDTALVAEIEGMLGRAQGEGRGR